MLVAVVVMLPAVADRAPVAAYQVPVVVVGPAAADLPAMPVEVDIGRTAVVVAERWFAALVAAAAAHTCSVFEPVPAAW